MKIIAAGFTTALLVFAVASALSELVLTSDAVTTNESAVRPQTNRSKRATVRSSRSPKSPSQTDTAKVLDADEPVEDVQQVLREIRQRERDMQAKEEALRLVFEEIREEQQTVEQLRRQVAAEIAAKQEASFRTSSRKESRADNRPAPTLPTRTVSLTTTAKPILSVRDPQAVQDAAVLIGRLAKYGSLQSATALLRNMKDRDATKVLTALSEADSQLALQLSQQLLASRNEESVRR